MFEKIKDFLYDISDMVLSIIIIGLIFYSVSWKISDTLSPDLDVSSRPVLTDETTPVVVIPDPDDAFDETPDDEQTPDETPDDDHEVEVETPVVEEPLVFERFVVETGSSSYAIGQQLERQGFITNVNDFTKRILERGVDRSLRAGEFQLSKSDDLDIIIDVLTGRGR